MNDEYLLHDPAGIQALLRSFSPNVRKRGELLVRSGAVKEMSPVQPGSAYRGVVEDGPSQSVELYCQARNGSAQWLGECSCPRTPHCEHVFALMRELLAQHSAADVRTLSAGAARPTAKPPIGQELPRELEPRLKTVLGRQLNKSEIQFLRHVKRVWQQSRHTGQITHWDFSEMGLRLKTGYGWEGLKIWPSTPTDEYDFWLYVANAARERGADLPEFMEPITDLAKTQELLAQWRRTTEIQRWRSLLGSFTSRPGIASPLPEGDTDLRFVIQHSHLQLEYRRPGETEFQPVKPAQFRQLQTAHQQGILRLVPEADWLWQGCSELFTYGPTVDWTRPQYGRVLSRLLRVGTLATRIVVPGGSSLPYIPEPLHWAFDPATSEHDNYRLRLVQADGSPIPTPFAALPGDPALYLTAAAVFKGPACPDSLLNPEEENLIPAPALETPAGVALLQTLKLDLPPRLRHRVRTLPFQVTIQCALRPGSYNSSQEDCALHVSAGTADGRRLTWTGFNWRDGAPKARNSPDEGEMITVYNSAVLEETRELLEPLQLRPIDCGEDLVVRVSRKFPELFSDWLKTIPPHIIVRLDGDLASLAHGDVAGRVKLEATETEIDWFDLSVILDVSDATLSKREIDLLLKANGKYVRLEGKGWHRLQFNLTEEESERLARLGLSAGELSGECQRLHALQLADEAAKSFLPEEQVQKIQRRASEIKARVTPPLPEGVSADFRPYQVEGFHFLAYLSTNRFGGILADDMGLGKTLQTLAWLIWLRSGTGQSSATPSSGESNVKPSAPEAPPPSLVVCPKSVMDNWLAEADRFTSGLRVKVWSATELDQFNPALSSADLHVLNYSQLRTLGETLAAIRWQAVILDEGQYIKNPNSQTAQVARALRAEHRLVLSGTPIENRLLDLWSLMTFAMPGVLGSRAHFAKLYGAKGDPLARRRLAARVRPFLLRRTKSQVAKDLPDRIEEDLFCELEGEQNALYRAELKRAQQLLLGIKTQKELAQQQFHFLVSLLRLRQICCDPRLRQPDSAAPSAKTEALLEHLEPLMEEGQKVLVFSQFVELLDLLRPLLKARNWPAFYLAGHTENRGQLVREFQSALGPAIFLISLKAGGFGLNLTAASYVVLFDPWWNPAVESQAIDRTHRIGQTNKVIAYRLLIKNSIEEKIRLLQKQKKALAEDVLGEEKFAQSLTLDDLHFLFAD